MFKEIIQFQHDQYATTHFIEGRKINHCIADRFHRLIEPQHDMNHTLFNFVNCIKLFILPSYLHL